MTSLHGVTWKRISNEKLTGKSYGSNAQGFQSEAKKQATYGTMQRQVSAADFATLLVVTCSPQFPV